MNRENQKQMMDKQEEDKKSIKFFMTKMTQQEFEEIRNGKEIIKYEFNTIKKKIEKCS